MRLGSTWTPYLELCLTQQKEGPEDKGFERGQKHKGYNGEKTQEKALDRESEDWVLGAGY